LNYGLSPDDSDPENKREVKQGLVKAFYKAFLAVLQQERIVESQENNIEEIRGSVIERIANEKFFDDIKDNRRYLILTVAPKYQIPNKINLGENEAIFREFLVPMCTSGWDHRYFGNRFVTYSRSFDEKIDLVSEISDEGIINAVGHRVISTDDKVYKIHDEEVAFQAIPTPAFDGDLLNALHKYLNILDKLGIDGPWMVAAGMINLGKSLIYYGAGSYGLGHTFQGGDVLPDAIEIPGDINLDDIQIIAQKFKPVFDYIWREFNHHGSIHYTSEGFCTLRL